MFIKALTQFNPVYNCNGQGSKPGEYHVPKNEVIHKG